MSETEPHGALFDEFPAVDAADWRRAVQEDLGTTDIDAFLEWTSVEGVSVPAHLRRGDVEDLPHVPPDADTPPLAGVPNDWTICQPLHHPDTDTANEHARNALDGGADSLQLSHHPSAQVSSLRPSKPEDVTTLLNGIDLSMTGLHLDEGLGALELYVALRESLSDQRMDPQVLRGSVRFDPVAVHAAGEVGDVDRAFSLAHDLLHETEVLSQFQSVSIDARVYHDAGASAVQELTCTLGALTERLSRSIEQGRTLSTVLDDLHFIVPISTSYFVEIAKLRALRLLVPQVVNAFVAESQTDLDFASTDLRIHAETSRRTETIYDPYVNMLRATTESMAAVVGGCDALTVRPYDAALRRPDAFGLRIARNVQLILEHEAHLDQVADPAAGSYYVETLTDKLAQRAWAQFQKLEAEGGIIETLRSGTLQEQIAETRQERRNAIDEREQILVGTTHYPALDERRRDDLDRPDGSPSSNGSAAPLPLPSLDKIRTAVRDGATLPAITSSLQNEESPIAPLPRVRVAEEIETIRLRTEAYAEDHDGPPQVLLAPMGPPTARSARATFARNFLGVAGVAIEEPLQFESADEAAAAAVDHDADIVVLCSSNDEYPDLTPALSAALDDRGHESLLGIAGSPNDIDVDQADFFVHQGSPLNETLTTLQERLGIDVTSDP